MKNETILLKKNVFNFYFKVNLKNIQYYDDINIKVLDIKKYFKVNNFSNYNVLNSISKFNLNIFHAMFIKLLINLDINLKNNILILNSNTINIIGLHYYLLLHNKYNLLNNIYVKNNIYITDTIHINLFSTKIKYDFIIYDGKKLFFKNINIDLNILEEKYINFLYESVQSINMNLNKNGSILLLFRFFYIEQVIDYIRLISQHFEICKIYDFIITEIDDLFFIYFENYNGIPIKLKSMYFSFENKIEYEELDKLLIMLKKRYYLQKKLLYMYSNITEEAFKKKKLKKEVSLMKSIGFTDYDLNIITKKKITDFLYYLKEFDNLKKYQFDKKININYSSDIEQEILTLYKKILLSYEFIDKNKYIESKRYTRFYKDTLNKEINKLLKTNHISLEWCKSLEMYHFIFSVIKSDNLKSYHLAEYQGDFICSLQYYCKNKNILLKDWKAQSDVKDQNTFSKNTSKHWDYGFDKTGNLLSQKNKKYYISSIKSFCPNFITADAGVSSKDCEQNLIKAEIFIILSSLQINGSCLIKVFLPSLELKNEIQCLYESFEELYFLKSPINKYSPEFYIFGYKLKKRVSISKIKKNKLFEQFYYMYILKLLQTFEKQINIQFFIYQHYDVLAQNNVFNKNKLIQEKNNKWIDKYIFN